MGIFTLTSNGSGYQFTLMAGNGEIIGTSQNYSSAVQSESGVKAVMADAPKAEVEDHTLTPVVEKNNPKFLLSVDQAGKFHWDLYGADGKVILISQAYLSIKNAMKGIRSVQKNAPIGTLEKK